MPAWPTSRDHVAERERAENSVGKERVSPTQPTLPTQDSEATDATARVGEWRCPRCHHPVSLYGDNGDNTDNAKFLSVRVQAKDGEHRKNGAGAISDNIHRRKIQSNFASLRGALAEDESVCEKPYIREKVTHARVPLGPRSLTVRPSSDHAGHHPGSVAPLHTRTEGGGPPSLRKQCNGATPRRQRSIEGDHTVARDLPNELRTRSAVRTPPDRPMRPREDLRAQVVREYGTPGAGPRTHPGLRYPGHGARRNSSWRTADRPSGGHRPSATRPWRTTPGSAASSRSPPDGQGYDFPFSARGGLRACRWRPDVGEIRARPPTVG